MNTDRNLIKKGYTSKLLCIFQDKDFFDMRGLLQRLQIFLGFKVFGFQSLFPTQISAKRHTQRRVIYLHREPFMERNTLGFL
jgi:hypothetical protein